MTLIKLFNHNYILKMQQFQKQRLAKKINGIIF